MGTHDRVVSRYLVVAAVLPAAVVAVALALQISWRGDVPDPMATHWGPSGRADGYGSPVQSIVLTAVVGLGISALIAAMTLPTLRRGARGATYRFMGAFSFAMVTFIAVLVTWLMGMQRGLADASQAPLVGWPMLGALGAGAGAWLVGWLLQPSQASVIPEWDEARALDLASGERAVWAGTATIGRGLRALLLSVLGVLVALTAVTWFAADIATGLITLATTAVVALAFAASLAYHVRVDERGLEAVSAIGWPRLRVDASDVVSAGVAPVNGFAEFGGYGVRVRPGATGIVLRNGDALQVTRASGRRLVITVDDAATAAALLTAMARRAAGAGSN